MIDAPRARTPATSKSSGLNTGRYAIHPFNGARVPIWIGNFVLMGYGTGAIMAVPAHDERDFEFCRAYGIPVVPVIRPVTASWRWRTMTEALSRNTESSKTRANGPGSPARKRASRMAALCKRTRLRRGDDHLPHQRLGHLAAALLGHADPDGPLRQLRHRSRSRKQICPVVLPLGREDHRQGPFAARSSRVVHECVLPAMRRTRHAARATPWTPLSIRRGISIATATRITTNAPFDSKLIAQLVSHRSIHRRRRARHSAPDLFAVLDQDDAGHRPDSRMMNRCGACSLRAW